MALSKELLSMSKQKPVMSSVFQGSALFNVSLEIWLQPLRRACKKGGERLFTGSCSDRTRGKGIKLKKGRFWLDIRKKFFAVSMVRHWKMQPKVIVGALSLDVFKSGCTGLWATWSSGWHHFTWKEVCNRRYSRVHYNTILWFHAYRRLTYLILKYSFNP